MSHPIELHRMVNGFESSTVNVDDETLERIKNKDITREELNDLFDEGRCSPVEPLDNDYPHSVYVVNSSTSYDFEEE